MGRRTVVLFLLSSAFCSLAFPKQLIVPGDQFATIQSAIDGAEPGDRILVRPGQYEETIRLRNGVHVSGDATGDVIVHCPYPKGPVVTVEGCSEGSVRGLTLRHDGLPDESKMVPFGYPVVLLRDSRIELADCTMSGGAGDGILIVGTGQPRIHDCVSQENRGSGLNLSTAECEPHISSSKFLDNKYCGVMILYDGSRATIQKCVMDGNGTDGFWLPENAEVSGRDNDFSRNGSINPRSVRRLYYYEEWDFLEAMAEHLRMERLRFANGEWQLNWFYGWLYWETQGMSPQEMDDFEAKVGKWSGMHPDSITWRIVLACAFKERAWGYRGGGYSYTVSDLGWAGYRRYLSKAWDIVDEAGSIDHADPEFYRLQFSLTMEFPERGETSQSAIGSLRKLARSLTGKESLALKNAFENGVNVEPLYLPLYYERVRSLLPRWGGSVEALRQFAERSTELTKEEMGQGMYALIAYEVFRWEDWDTYLGEYQFDWKRIRQGFEDQIEDHPLSIRRKSQLARIACEFRDQDAATLVFQALGSQWSDAAWVNQSHYDHFRAWALGQSPYPEPSPLEAAIGEENAVEVRRLLDLHADPNATNVYGYPLVFLAVESEHFEVAELLVSAGANVNGRDVGGQPLLRSALNEDSTDALSFWLENGSDPNAKDLQGYTPLVVAISWNRPQMIPILLDHGADINLPSDNGVTPLCQAAYDGNSDVIRLLLDKGADCNAKVAPWEPPMLVIARRQDVELISVLLDHGANPNFGTEKGWTALFEATDAGNLDFVKLLIAHGADVTAPEENGWTVFHNAIAAGAPQVLHYLLEQSPESIHITDDNGRTLLQQAAKSGNVELVKFFLEKGLDTNAREKEKNLTALGFALAGKHAEIAELLRQHGAIE